MKKLIYGILFALLILSGCGTTAVEEKSTALTEPSTETESSKGAVVEKELSVVEDGRYDDMESVAKYLHAFGKLPAHYLTKGEARKRGWIPEKGNLREVVEGGIIGGDRFGNREGLLPEKEGRQYYECDVNYEGGPRGAERLVYSDDGLIFYTEDHYESFTQIY